jgi:hypothetical protein
MPHVGLWPDRRWYGALNVRFWGNSGHAAMSTAGSLNELFQTENSSDTAFTNSDAGANGSDAAGGNWGCGTLGAPK